MEKYIYMVACKFEGSSKAYLFEAPTYIFPDTEVLVDTRHGASRAKVMGSQYVEIDSDMYKLLLAISGATMPLKRVIGKYDYTEFEYRKEA